MNAERLHFYLYPHKPQGLRGRWLQLVHHNWDDFFEYQTLYNLTLRDGDDEQEIGHTKIGRKGMQGAGQQSERHNQRKPEIPMSFTTLPSDFFSLGQDDTFYTNLESIGSNFRKTVLLAIRDIAYDNSLFETHSEESVLQTSLLRFVTPHAVTGRLKRLADGKSALVPYRLVASTKPEDDAAPVGSFQVDPESKPPTNIHVLIGRNGVGKSRYLQLIAEMHSSGKDLLGDEKHDDSGIRYGKVANCLYISFSALDTYPIPGGAPTTENDCNPTRTQYIGLRKHEAAEEQDGLLKSSYEVAEDLLRSSRVCKFGDRRERLEAALGILESDPIFKDADIRNCIFGPEDKEYDLCDIGKPNLSDVFRELSSGHKLVLYAVVSIIERIEEKSLVLFDEPESHLHPPLQSALARCLSYLMYDRNGICILATHSPVFLQEVPSKCVTIMNRVGQEVSLQSPKLQTFAENTGTLTHEVFGLEVKNTGFYKVLQDDMRETGSKTAVAELYKGEIGSEGLALLALLEHRKG